MRAFRFEVAECFRNVGYDAVTVLEQQMGGYADPDIAAVCRREARCLVTLDIDFADLRTYPPESFAGIVVFRLKRQDKPSILKLVGFFLSILQSEPLEGHLWIVEQGRIRIRGSTTP